MINNLAIPWEGRPEGSTDVMWRYSQNPVIGRYHIPSSNSIFNSAVVPFKDGFAGVFRCDNKAVQMNIFAGFSKDGINWEINQEPIVMVPGNTEMIDSAYKYDPRVTFIEDRYWVTWCNGYHGPTIGIAYTFDFVTFHQCENAFLPFNRNGVLFPEKIDGKYAMTVEVNLPEKYINDVMIDQPVRIMNYTLPNDTLNGNVKELSPAISTETRTFKGIIQVANPELKLRPGMFAKADIVLARKDSVIVIPKEIIISTQRGKSVFIVDNGTAVEKRITLGYENQNEAEITSGLKRNDRLVIKGFETLKNRSKVKIVK